MKIALVHEMLTKLGGGERVAKKLTQLYPKSPLYTLFQNKKATQDCFKEVTIHPSALQPLYEAFRNPKFLLPKMPGAIEQFDFSHYDVVISSSSAFAHGIKTGSKTKHVCYCHSPMRYAWDYTHEYTRNYHPLTRLGIAHLLKSLRQWDVETAGRPDIVIANSKHVQKRVRKYWRREAHVIYPPVQTERFTPTQDHEDYFLIVSALTPFKRIELAVQAFNKIKRKLVIIGEGSQRSILESMAEDNIEFLGYKDDEATARYMEHCRALIFPGEEDFGITPVEAMAAGKPVLAYGRGGVTESVCEGISGEFFEEASVDSLLEGLTRLMVNEKNYQREKIRAIAEGFDASIFEEKIRELVKTIS